MADEQAIRELREKMAEERARLLALVQSLDEAEAEQAPEDAEGEAQWSPKEQCAHLNEMETAYRACVERALVEDNPDVAKLRGEQVAIPLEEANGRPIAGLVAEMRRQRERTRPGSTALPGGNRERYCRESTLSGVRMLIERAAASFRARARPAGA